MQPVYRGKGEESAPVERPFYLELVAEQNLRPPLSVYSVYSVVGKMVGIHASIRRKPWVRAQAPAGGQTQVSLFGLDLAWFLEAASGEHRKTVETVGD